MAALEELMRHNGMPTPDQVRDDSTDYLELLRGPALK
jgi:hypothetical protein